MSKIKIISVDFQNDFTTKGGVCYRPRKSVPFIKSTLIPFLRSHNIKIAEIISDYRQPRPGDRGDCCHPGEWGYESGIPDDIKLPLVWIKCMNSPLWTRKNIGNKNKKPGLPFQDPNNFNKWLNHVIGDPKDKEIILIGLTSDCCVFCTAQELNWRGYKVKLLQEAVDNYSGSEKEKDYLLNNPPLTNWAKSVSWRTLRCRL